MAGEPVLIMFEYVMVLQGAQHGFASSTDILNSLVPLHRDTGNREAARMYADKLRSLSPRSSEGRMTGYRQGQVLHSCPLQFLREG